MYRAFDLLIRSNFNFNLFCSTENASKWDVSIVVDHKGNDKIHSHNQRVVRKNTEAGYLIYVKEIGSFLIQPDRIKIQAQTEDIGLLESALVSEAIPALIAMRGFVFFNASVLMHSNKMYMILGDAGIGKSAIAAGLFKRGYTVLGDQKCALNVENGTIKIVPDYLKLKLWQDSLEQLEINKSQLQRVRKEIDKYYVELPSREVNEYQIDALFFIELSNQHKGLKASKLDYFSTLKRLNHHQIKFEEAFSSGQKTQSFEVVTKLASQCKSVQITRPQAVYDIGKVTHFIEQQIKTNE